MQLRAWPWIVGLGAGLAAAACQQQEFTCSSNDACGAGICEASGYCSFPDDDCDSGRRYGDQAPVSFAGICVPVAADTGTDSPADDSGASTTDAPPVTSSGQAVDESTGDIGTTTTDADTTATTATGDETTDTEGCVQYYPDVDGDTFGGEPPIEGCGEVPPGYTEQPGDCDDSDARIYPGGLGCPNPDSLIAWWRFDAAVGNIVANEVLGNGDAVLQGLPTISETDGPYGAALGIDAPAESGAIGEALGVFAPNGVLPPEGAIEAWVKPTLPDCPDGRTLICGSMVVYFGPDGSGDGYGGGSEHHIGTLALGDGTYEWRAFMNSDDDSCSASGPIVEFDAWVHIAMTWSEGICNLWLNGDPVGSDVKGELLAGASTGHIGRPNSDGVREFRGEIDEVMLFNEARTQIEIQSDCGCGGN